MLCFYPVEVNKFIFLIIFYLSVLKLYRCESCTFVNTCECIFRNGSIIDLTSVGSHTSYRWGNLKAKKTDNFTYYYNPCFGFSLGRDDCSAGVAVCQVSKAGKEYNCGNAKDVNFVLDNRNMLKLIYSAPPRTTNVTLVCSEDAYTPELTVDGEMVEMQYAMTLKTRCACPDLCHTSHLSTGSVLVILFMIFMALYLVLGIIHSSLTRGAHGWELIPHYEFWADFPLLVRDGCVFVVSGCKPETAYERI